MSLGQYRFIGICMTQIQENLPSDFVHAAVERAVEYGYKVLIYNCFSDLYVNQPYDIGESKVFDLIRYDLLDGLIVMGETIKDKQILNTIIQTARDNGIYTVSVDKRIEGCFNIEFNYRSAFESIVRHVVEKHNCRTINLVAGFKNNSFSDERIACCRNVLEQHGLKLDENRIMYGDFWADPTAKALDEFMKSGMEMPDAFICCNDSMAITICAKLKDYGYTVPDDVIVTGFDGILEEQYHIPRLTTAKQDVALAGEKAVDTIHNSLHGRDPGNFCIIDHKVIKSHSCGCKPINYREATGQISPLFQMTDADNNHDTYMFEFSTAGATANGMTDLSRIVHKYSNPFCWHYFGINLNEDFMNMSDTYESFIMGEDEKAASEKRLILCESYWDNRYDPYFAPHCEHFEEAVDKFNVFLYWSIHFQEKSIGYGIMGLGMGGDDVYRNDDFRHIVKYTRNLNHVLEIANSRSVMNKVIAKLQDLYIRDHTGLYNRRGFYNEIKKYLDQARSNKDTDTYLIIISVDMDGLKTINDTYGHAEGDVALKAIASALISVWGKNEICSRFGGDEFTVASICTESPDEAGRALADRIQAHLDEYNATSGKPYKVRSSFGIHYDKIDDNFIVDNLIKIADDLMYKEKARHKESRYRSSVRENN